MIKPINHDQSFLSKPVVPATANDREIITDLIDTITAHQKECVGMAANMIGINKSIIVVQMGLLPVIMVNPQITKKSDPSTVEEGCLSLAGTRSTTRYRQITVTYLDQQFQPHTQQFSDWIAQIIQHEVDHCNGILI